MPRRAATPGRKPSSTTSASAARRRKTSRPAACLRLSVMLRLLRARNEMPMPNGSSGAATTSTSMPRSASSVEQNGPAAGARGRGASSARARGPASVERRLEDHRAVLVEEEERRRGRRPPLALAPRTQHRARLPLLLELKGGEPLSGDRQAGTAPAAGVHALEARRALGHD